jgi:hypothetical protein
VFVAVAASYVRVRCLFAHANATSGSVSIHVSKHEGRERPGQAGKTYHGSINGRIHRSSPCVGMHGVVLKDR